MIFNRIAASLLLLCGVIGCGQEFDITADNTNGGTNRMNVHITDVDYNPVYGSIIKVEAGTVDSTTIRPPDGSIDQFRVVAVLQTEGGTEAARLEEVYDANPDGNGITVKSLTSTTLTIEVD